MVALPTRVVNPQGLCPTGGQIQHATDNIQRWHAIRRRIQERFPDAPLMNHSLHLPTGGHDACYSFASHLPGATRDRAL
jgi:hypothetical protein